MSTKVSTSRYLGDSSRLRFSLSDPDTGGPFNPAGHRLLFTVKLAASQPDTDALIQKLSTVGGIVFLESPDIGVDLVPADFAKIKPDIAYVFDVQAQNGDTGAVKTVCKGTIVFDEDVTKQTELSVPTFTTEPAAVPIGQDGKDGWSPVLAFAADGARRVAQVIDWTGGEGVKPAVGKYIGVTGLVALIADAIDLRGPQGIQGAPAALFGNLVAFPVDSDVPGGAGDYSVNGNELALYLPGYGFRFATLSAK